MNIRCESSVRSRRRADGHRLHHHAPDLAGVQRAGHAEPVARGLLTSLLFERGTWRACQVQGEVGAVGGELRAIGGQVQRVLARP